MSTRKVPSSIWIDQLHQGIEEMDRIRNQIDRDVSTIIGLVTDADTEKYRSTDGSYLPTVVDLRSDTSGLVWKITLWSTIRKQEDPVRLDGAELVAKTRVLYRYTRSASAPENMKPKLPDVMAVYGQLQQFLDGMIEVFPGLTHSLSPIMEAARSAR